MTLTHRVALSTLLLSSGLLAQIPAYDSIPSPLPGNVVSQGYQCCSVSEFGDEIHLASGTPRTAGSVKVVMSSWSKHSDYPLLPAAGYTHPIRLNIYGSASAAESHTPLASVPQNAPIPWRPEADPTCANPTQWRSPVNNVCYNGFAFILTFDLRTAGPGGTPLTLPETFIFGVEFNTNTWGYTPIGQPGPYESLNVGLNDVTPPSVGTDVESDAVYVNYKNAGFYTDGGAGGTGTFRRDTNWTPYVPAVQFLTYRIAAAANDCKNGGWQTLARANSTSFKNQGDCVSYVQSGK